MKGWIGGCELPGKVGVAGSDGKRSRASGAAQLNGSGEMRGIVRTRGCSELAEVAKGDSK